MREGVFFIRALSVFHVVKYFDCRNTGNARIKKVPSRNRRENVLVKYGILNSRFDSFNLVRSASCRG